jgi:transcription antitermination factor NusG
MPILEAEVNIYPTNLLHDALRDDEQRSWWALMTKSRQEKSVARHLLSREVPFYLPLIWKDNLIRGRKVRSHIPLFSNYIFLYGTPDDRVTALQSNRLTETLHVVDQQELLNDLRNIEQLIAADAPLTVESRLKPGHHVRVKSGAMRGVDGVVTERRSRSRLLVAVHFLQSGVSVEIDDFMLEPIG